MVMKLLRGLTVFLVGAAGLVVAAPGNASVASGHATAAPGQAVAVRPAGGRVTLVSVNSTGKSANYDSWASGISAHGRFVAFGSAASNLVPRDTNGVRDVFVRDRLTGITTRESVLSHGAQINDDTFSSTLSADGSVIAFAGIIDVFARDRVRGVTELVSVATNGRKANDYTEGGLAISANGRYVAFESYASNLVPGDTAGHSDVFVRDRARRVTERVSVATNGRQGNGGSGSPSISSDGRYVAFESYASNLVRGDTNRVKDVFVRDRLKRVTTRVSLNSASRQFTKTESFFGGISGNGRYVVFLVGITGDEDVYIQAMYVRDRLRGVTRRVPVPSSSQLPGDRVTLSQNGRYVAYYDWGRNVYIWDQWRNLTRRLPSVGDSYPILSADGHHAAFTVLVGSKWLPSVYAWDDVSDAFTARPFR